MKRSNNQQIEHGTFGNLHGQEPLARAHDASARDNIGSTHHHQQQVRRSHVCANDVPITVGPLSLQKNPLLLQRLMIHSCWLQVSRLLMCSRL